MPHYKCVSCRTRLRVALPPTACVPDLCPQCGSLLEPVDDLAEVIGFRAIAPVDGFAVAAASAEERVAHRIGDLVRHRERQRARALPQDEFTGSLGDRVAGTVVLPRPDPDR